MELVPSLQQGPYAAPVPQDRAHSKRLLTAGLLLLTLCVVGFVHYARRDAATLREGVRIPGEVVGKIDARAWDWMDSGRIVVAYPVDGELVEAKVWIDNELSDYAIGDEVTVIVRGDHVRTAREPNDPAPVGLALVLLGLTGLGLGVVGGRRLLPQPTTSPEPPPGALDRIALVTWRIAPRKAALDVLPGELSAYLPTFFGGHRLVMPIHGTAVGPVDEDERYEYGDEYGELPRDWDAAEEDDIYFAEPPRIAEFPTPAVIKPGNLLLLFDRPVRVPVLRRVVALAGNSPLAFTRRETLSEQGAHIDGALLRAVDPHDARERLIRAGVTPVEEPFGWLAERREVHSDPAEVAAMLTREAKRHLGRAASAVGYVVGWLLLVAGQWRDDFRLAGAGVALWAVTFLAGRLPRSMP